MNANNIKYHAGNGAARKSRPARWLGPAMIGIVSFFIGEPVGTAATILAQVEVDLGYYESVQERPWQDAGLAVAFVLPGRGHRAANYEVGAMLALEEMLLRGGVNALGECDYLVSNSSGGCAAAGYLVTLNEHWNRFGTRRGYSFARALDEKQPGRWGMTPREALRANYFRPLATGLGRDLIPGGATRGDKLQESSDRHLLHGLRFGDVFAMKGSGRKPRLPYWFPYSTAHANGSIVVHSPDVYRQLGVSAFRDGRRSRKVNGDFGDVPWSLALRASIAFPIVVPPCTLETSLDPERPYLNLRDGGMADNIGTNPALSLLRQDGAKRKLMIVVDAIDRPDSPCCPSRRTGGVFSTALKSAYLPMDARLHRYRENLVVRDIRLDSRGNILSGTTHDGIRVVFLYPELLPDERQKEFKDVGLTLKLRKEKQDFLFSTGRQIVEIQRDAIAWGLGDGVMEPSAVALDAPAPGNEAAINDAVELKASLGTLPRRAFDRPLKFLRLRKR